jgi:predicted dehydrogenase
MLRGGIIGLGNVALHGHLPGWLGRGDAEIIAAADTRPEQRTECEARLPGARWYDSAADLLADPRLDFVDICTPPSSHADLIRSALERGLHVLCEKPLVTAAADLRPLAGLAARGRRALHTVHNWHHAPIARRTAELIQQGAIGRTTAIAWQTLRTRPAVAGDGRSANWRLDPEVAGGGVLTDHGWHVCYLLRRWAGARPTAIGARLETRRHKGVPVEDTAELRLAFPHATAEVLLTWAADVRRNWAEVRGVAGSIELLDDTLVLRQPGGERRWSCPPALSNGSHHPDWFDAVAEQFLAEATGRAPGGANLEEAALCVTLEALARESSRWSGAMLPLPPLDWAAGAESAV